MSLYLRWPEPKGCRYLNVRLLSMWRETPPTVVFMKSSDDVTHVWCCLATQWGIRTCLWTSEVCWWAQIQSCQTVLGAEVFLWQPAAESCDVISCVLNWVFNSNFNVTAYSWYLISSSECWVFLLIIDCVCVSCRRRSQICSCQRRKWTTSSALSFSLWLDEARVWVKSDWLL